MENAQSWGVFYTSDIRKAGDHRCPGCDTMYPVLFDVFSLAIGFACDQDWQKIENSAVGKSVGILILECPVCFEKGWIHLYSPLKVAEKFCPRWPK